MRAKSLPLLRQLFETLDARLLPISFNDDGVISPEEMRATLSRLGRVRTFETRYNTYRASRNLRNRPILVTEQLFFGGEALKFAGEVDVDALRR